MPQMQFLFDQLPYHAELWDLAGQIPVSFAESSFDSERVKDLPMSSRYLENELSTLDYLGLLAKYSVSKTWSIYVNLHHESVEQSPEELAAKLRKDMFDAAEVLSISDQILKQVQWGMNEKGIQYCPSTHKIFTRFTKLRVCQIAFEDEMHGRNFLAFFRAFNPSWKFQRAGAFIRVSYAS